MILIDYFLYKIYRFLLKKPVYETVATNMLFSILLLVNVNSSLLLSGFSLNSNFARYCMIGLFIISNVLLYYFYERRKRYQKIFEKFKNESKSWKIVGWVLVLCYIAGTIIFAILS